MYMDIPNAQGSYALELVLERKIWLRIGKLGRFEFPGGRYIYTGSALGPGGLRARLARHLHPSKDEKLHWHIDYLRQAARPSAFAFLAFAPKSPQDMSVECLWSQVFRRLEGGFIPASGFGASDCRSHCGSHLIAFANAGPHPLLAEGAVRVQIAAAAGVRPDSLGFFQLLPEVK